MRGDYSRGHEPDRKRGRNYRRVLLQMGRPILDSDIAASVDAILGEVRAVARVLGCAGSTDLGFLVTPGRLLAIFGETEGIAATAGTPDVWIDYRFRFAGRSPALYIKASGGAAGVSIPLAQAFEPGASSNRIALWARVESPVTITVNGVSVPLTPGSPDAPERVELAAGSTAFDQMEVQVPDGDELWLFLAEQVEAAGSEPAFWIAPGSYQVDGLVLDAGGGGSFPEAAFPDASGFSWRGSPQGVSPLDGILAPNLSAGTRLVAYLEAHERHITRVEDPGIREQALGGIDTSARTKLLGQIKLATDSGLPVSPSEAANAARDAFGAVTAGGGKLTIEVAAPTDGRDPCDVPETGGYTGADNRLYRFEVHRGGGLSQVRLVWSRNNGSELFGARLDNGRVVFDAGTPLAAGDLVEVLSHVVDLGDDVIATVDAGGFEPARRAVGQLAQLVEPPAAGSSDEVAFTLVDPGDQTTPVVLDGRYGDPSRAVLKVRRWDGILDPQAIAGAGAATIGPHPIEDGIRVALSSVGEYRPGDYWQYEARASRENANGPWRDDPHGPERRFAPLALLEFQATNQPLRLLAWLDERFPAPCGIEADDVEFVGGRVGSPSDTVQEALEELFEKPPIIVDTGCGELVVRPENDLQAVFDTIPPSGNARICIHPGTWEIGTTIDVQGKGDLIVSGAGQGTTLLQGLGVDTVLRFRECVSVSIRDLAVEGGKVGAVGDGLSGSIQIVSPGTVDIERVRASCGGAPTGRLSAVEVRAPGPPVGVPRVRIHDCDVEAGHAQVGLLLINAGSADIQRNAVSSQAEERVLAEEIPDPEVAGTVGRVLIDDLLLGDATGVDDEIFVGSPVVTLDPESGGRRRVIGTLQEWGTHIFLFKTTLGLDADAWMQLLLDNPLPGATEAVPEDYVRAGFRRLRRELVASMFADDPTIVIHQAFLNVLRDLASALQTANSVTAGGQGIVLAGGATSIDPAFPEPVVLPLDPRPDARLIGNRVTGYVQGVHVAASEDDGARRLSYRVVIDDNTVHLRVPSLTKERHGIYVGSTYLLRIKGNTVELTDPPVRDWLLAGRIDGIRAWGTFGPLVQVRENSCIGTTNGVVVHATNPAGAANPGWTWAVSETSHVGSGGGVPVVHNW
jgi:hypothetical protein